MSSLFTSTSLAKFRITTPSFIRLMAVEELKDFLVNGNIRNSVNFPACDMGVRDKTRITILHRNIPNMIGQFTALLAKDNVNIDDMTNKSRGSYAYTMIDVDNDVEKTW